MKVRIRLRGLRSPYYARVHVFAWRNPYRKTGERVGTAYMSINKSIDTIGTLLCGQNCNYFSQNREFVCVEVLRPSQPNGVMSSAVSLHNHTFTGQALSSKRLTSIVHILSPETDNCPSWISGRERMTVENISWSISTKECCRPRRG